MAKKVLLKDGNEIVLPITRGELIVDSSGNPAFHSSEFLASNSLPGLMSPEDKYKLDYEINYTIPSISLTKDWKSINFILNGSKGFTTGVYAIKIINESVMFSGIVSVVVGNITVEDEIVLHMSGISQNTTQERIYAKIAPSLTDDFGELLLATNMSQLKVTNLSITMKKLL